MRKIVGFLILLGIWSCSDDKEGLSTYHVLDDDVELQMVAQEPIIVAPVAMDFDKQGRIWVAEMSDYMPDINGKNEEIATGRIVILEDTDGDGIMDSSKVFLDQIHHLRALKLFRNGILYADNPNLYFATIENDKPVKTYVVDSTYAAGGNIEHKPNGLLLNIDNCFYSAKSHYRYCYQDDLWRKEVTNFRGQWGITNDENGRLYANDNSNLLFGDQFLPNTVIKNEYQHQPQGLNLDLVGDRSIFPIRATAINRGYVKGSLDTNGYVKYTTSACGPYIYQSSSLGTSYKSNVFVCIPEANLIKRLNLKQNDFLPNASFYYDTTEFLTSSDEAFRPVNITTGPDGDLYIVDFHRGIIQHKIYMTKYLKNEIIERKLDKVTDFGRILKLTNKNKKYLARKFDFTNEDSLLLYLISENSWLRSKAQECLIPMESKTIDAKLFALISGGDKVSQLHGLWTLAGRKKIDLKEIIKVQFEDPWVIANLLKIINERGNEFSTEERWSVIKAYKDNSHPIVKNHLLTVISDFYKSYPSRHSRVIQDADKALLSAKIAAYPSGTIIATKDSVFSEYNQRVEEGKKHYIFDGPKLGGSEGYDLYNQYCASCHGFGGQGIEGLAPKLENGKLVNASAEIVPLVILNGLKGPVTIDNDKQNYSGIMPSFNLTEKEIEKISNYIYNAFSNEVKSISSARIKSLYKKYSNQDKMWTEEELLNTKF